MSPAAWVLDHVGRRRRETARLNARQRPEIRAGHEATHALVGHRAGWRIARVDTVPLGGDALGVCDFVSAEATPTWTAPQRLAGAELLHALGVPPDERAPWALLLEELLAGAVGEACALAELQLGGHWRALVDPECPGIAAAIYGANHVERVLDFHAMAVADQLLDHRIAWRTLRDELVRRGELEGDQVHEILTAGGASFGGYTAVPWRAAAGRPCGGCGGDSPPGSTPGSTRRSRRMNSFGIARGVVTCCARSRRRGARRPRPRGRHRPAPSPGNRPR